MLRTRTLQLESLEDRLTPATLKFTAPLVNATTTNTQAAAVRTATVNTVTAPTIHTAAPAVNSYAPIGVGGTGSGSSGGPIG